MPCLFIDGVACCLKTSLLKKLNSNNFKCGFLDFTECIELYPKFADKAKSTVLTFIYTHLQIAQVKDVDMDFSDRSPITDLWYFIIFELYNKIKEDEKTNQRDTIENYRKFIRSKLVDFIALPDDRDNNKMTKLQSLLYTHFFTQFPTLYLIPKIKHIPDIVQQMKIRNNGIDLICEDYVLAQILVFSEIIETYQIPNSYIYNFDTDTIYSDSELNKLYAFTNRIKQRVDGY
ncbi:HZV_115 [Dikerogammarus haemobaphes nudivirus]|nr:HZV_115 [Dikerogammarus haemobaphes nudivirus]